MIDGNALIDLFAARTTVGSGAAFQWAGGEGLLQLDGTWGGTAFKLQYSFDGTAMAFKDLDDSVEFTADGAVVFTLPPGAIRGVLTGGSAMNLNARVRRIP